MISLYLHWPFCISKCPYCDFNSHVANNDINIEVFVEGYVREIQYFHDIIAGKKISSIYFGGGTPSLAPLSFYEKTLTLLDKISPLSNDVEITMEANPSSSEYKKFKEFHRVGINRVSIGIQSLNNNYLKFLGRAHNREEAIQAIESARAIFTRYSFDLIYALPQQTLEEWLQELEEACQFINGHISLYQLTIEKGTKFYNAYRNKEFIMPTEENAAIFYEKTEEYLKKHNIIRYEVSNYAMPGQESQHNMNYWRYGDYLGIGPGAHSRYIHHGKRHAMFIEHNPKKWIEMVMQNGNGIQKNDILNNDQEIQERILMGLRTQEGIPAYLITDLKKIQHLTENNLISINDKGNIAAKNVLLLNYIISYILNANEEL